MLVAGGLTLPPPERSTKKRKAKRGEFLKLKDMFGVIALGLSYLIVKALDKDRKHERRNKKNRR